MTVVVTGGAGFIGSALSKALLAKGHTVIVVDKVPPSITHQNLFFIQCDLEEELLPFNVLERTDAIIHLAGRSIFGRWNDLMKEKIMKSRVESTKHLVESLERTATRPPIFVAASGISYYGDGGDEEIDERSPKGTSYLSEVTEAWERESMQAEKFGCRVVIVRTAPVIGSGGFLKPLIKFAKFGMVFRFGEKNFWMPWVHIDDIVKIYMFALETSTLQGVVNAVAPSPIKHRDFMKTFAKVTNRKVLGKMPNFLIRLFYGDFIDEMTKSQKVLPRRLTDKGFVFEYTVLDGAIRSAIKDVKKH